MSNDKEEPPKDMLDETLFEQMRSLPRVVWILAAGMFIHRFGTFVVPFLTLYLDDQGYSAGRIGSVFAAIAVGGMGAMFLGGRLADMIGRRNTMLISLFGVAVTMILMLLANSYPAFLFAALLAGITGGMYHPASNSLLIDVVPPERRVTAFGTVRWALNLGFGLGMLAGGIIADHNFAWLFIGDAITSVIFAVIALLTLPHGVRTSKEHSRWIPAFRHMLDNPKFIILVIANALAMMTLFQTGSSMARLTSDLYESKSVYGWIIGLNGFLIAFFELGITRLTRKRPPTSVIALGYFLCGLGIWANLFADSWHFIAVAMIIFTIGEMIALPVAGAYVGALSPEKMRGRYNAGFGLTFNAAHGIAPWAGLVMYRHCPEILWWGCLGIGVISAALMLLPFRDPAP